MKDMRLDAFLCCLDYSDFLRITLPSNRKHFDRIVVITSPWDSDTKKVCRENDAEWINFDLMPAKKKFLFGSGLNYGYSVLNPSDWACKIDADILLPNDFRTHLESTLKDKEALYGARRLVINKKHKYRKWINKGRNFDRINKPLNINKIAQGFLQIFHSSASVVRQPLYSESGGADKVDNHFRNMFSNVVYLNKDVVHVGPSNENWHGRITESWVSEVAFTEDDLTEEEYLM